MDARKYEEMRSALRAAIQMGGASVIHSYESKRLPVGGGILAANVRHGQMHFFKRSIESPAQRLRDARRRLMSGDYHDGYHGEDRR